MLTPRRRDPQISTALLRQPALQTEVTHLSASAATAVQSTRSPPPPSLQYGWKKATCLAPGASGGRRARKICGWRGRTAVRYGDQLTIQPHSAKLNILLHTIYMIEAA